MAKYGLLFNLDRCIGCKTHMVVCRQEGNDVIALPIQTVAKTKPDLSEGVMRYFPLDMRRCTTSRSCVQRVAKGMKPRCVLSCPSRAMQFGSIEELAEYVKAKSMPHAYIVPF